MASTVPGTMKLEGNHPCLTSSPMESCGSECHGMDVPPSERAAIELVPALKSSGKISGYKLQGACNNGNDNDVTIARAASHAISKRGPDLFMTAAGSACYWNANPGAHVFTNSGIEKCWCETEILQGPYYRPYSVEQFSRQRWDYILLPWFFLVMAILQDKFDTPEVRSHRKMEHWRVLLSIVDVLLTAGRGSAQTDPAGHGTAVPVNFILDSGASKHVTGNRALLHGYRPLVQPWDIHVADGYRLRVVGIGYIRTQGFNILNVHYVEGLRMDLISVRQLDKDHGLLTVFHDGICKVMKRDGEIVGGGFAQDADGLYHLRFLEVPEVDE